MSDASINPATLEFLKKENAKRARQRKIMLVAIPLLLAGIATSGYYGIKAWRASSQEDAAKAFVAKNFEKGPSPDGFDQVRKAVDSGQFTWDQMRQAGREAWEKAEKERMTAYFNTPAKDRDKYLDKLIDEMQKRMKEFEAMREKMGPTTRPNWGDRQRGDGPTTRPDGERRERGMGGPGGRGDSTSPVDRAMNQEFRAALFKRMQERGIQMPGRGFGGFGGGRGGGPGGGGGNRGGGGGGGGGGGR